jgi:uncharacterized protein YjeT (DUF2065 family)
MIQWSDLGAAIALVFVIEGLLPLLAPRRFRETLLAATRLDDRALRLTGFASMIGGALLLYWIR